MKYLMTIVILVLSLNAQATDWEWDIGYYAKSHHIGETEIEGTDQMYDYNEEHQLFSIGVREDKWGVSLTRFKNSFHEESFMLGVTRYVQADFHHDFEWYASVGAVTGYETFSECGKSVCPTAMAGIQYNKYRYFKPRLSIFMGAVVFSLHANF